MKITPRLWMAAPAILVTTALCMLGAPLIAFTLAGNDPENVWISHLMVVVAVGVLCVVAAALGWLGPILFEQRRATSPLARVLAFAPFVYLAYCLIVTNWPALSGAAALVIVTSAIQAGIWEEFLFRGVAVVTLRATLSELWVALITSALFASIHLLNLTYPGARIDETLYQTLYAFLFGLAAYALRRVTGTIFMPILLHVFNNMLNSLASASGAPVNGLTDGSPLASVIFLGGLTLGAIAAFLCTRQPAASTVTTRR